MQQAWIAFICWCLISLSVLVHISFLFYFYYVGSPPLLLFCFSQPLVVPLESHFSMFLNPLEWEWKGLSFCDCLWNFFGLNSVFGNKPCSAFGFGLLPRPVILMQGMIQQTEHEPWSQFNPICLCRSYFFPKKNSKNIKKTVAIKLTTKKKYANHKE